MKLLNQYKEEILNAVAFSSYYNRSSDCYLKDRIKKKKFVYYKKGHTQFKTYEKDSTIYIIFEGTNGVSDWKDNFSFYKQATKIIPYDNADSDIRVHKGFIEQYKHVRETIHNIIQFNEYEKVIVTGHSLGGALAILCAVDLQYCFDIKPYCFAFANPNVGNKAFSKSFKKRIPVFQSFKNRNDVVCNIPLELFGYKDLGRIEVKSKKKGSIFGFALFGNWQDHYPNRYEQAIDDLLK
jgi:predicted esterase YcpF (UPF0227 family)